jgi:hypothetical protein
MEGNGIFGRVGPPYVDGRMRMRFDQSNVALGPIPRRLGCE